MRLYDINQNLEFLAELAAHAGEAPEEGIVSSALYSADEFCNAEGKISGELVQFLADALFEDREQKIENIAHFIVNLDKDDEILKAEIDRLRKRKEATQKRREWLAAYLQANLQGEAYRSKTSPLQIGYRKSVAVNITDEALLPAEFIRTVTKTEPDKTAIKTAIKNGQAVAGAELVERQNMYIK